MEPPFQIPLNDRTVLLFRGTDRVRFLNGQLSNDVRKLKPGVAMHACVMTLKGKMNADVWLTAEADSIRLDAAPGLSDELVTRFERYIISDDVEIEDLTGQIALYHLAGSDVPAGEPVSGTRALSSRRFRLPGVDWWGPIGHNPPGFGAALALTAPQIESFRIAQGVPIWGAELTGDTLPVEAGLDHDAIDYHKGCYIGQEVISRIKSVGHVNRQLVRLTGPKGLDLPPGTPLFVGEKEVGRVTSSATSLDLEKTVALAYLRSTALESTFTKPAELTVHPLIP